MTRRRFDVQVNSSGIAGAFGSGGQYIAQVYDANTGQKSDIYAYGSSEHEAKSKAVHKIRERYGYDAEIMY